MIKDVDLHDATLVAVRMVWKDGLCVADIRHGTLGNCVLTFSEVSNLTLPRKQDWARSASINSFLATSSSKYEIEKQSGDLIKIEGTGVSLTLPDQS